MQPPRQPMGWQIEYEICYEKRNDKTYHKEVDISVSMEDSIHWFCRNHKFRVLSVRPDTTGAPAELFYRKFPEDNREFAFHVNSGPAKPGTEDEHVYKPLFEFEDGEKLDPHIRTHK